MAKQHVENVKVEQVLAQPWAPTGFDGQARQRLLARDPANGACTAVLEVASIAQRAGYWEPAADYQLLVLAGELLLGDKRLGPGCYCYFPAGSTHRRWQCAGPLRLLAIFGADAAFGDARAASLPPTAIECLDTWALTWVDPLAASDPSTSFRPGVMVKVLREDPVTGHSTHLAGLMPGWYMPGMEVHPVYEENYCLSGDVHIGEVAGAQGYTMTPGSYLCRPPGIAHGPLVSKNGNVNLTYAHGRLGIDYRDNPRSMQLIERHLTQYPWA